MKIGTFMQTGRSQQIRTIGISMGLLMLSGVAVAQESLSLEELEKLVAEQQIALEEAISNREATAAQAEAVRLELEEARKRSREVEKEVEALCREQEELTNESFVRCMAASAG